MYAISFRHVRCFLEVARLSSVTQAADALAITQPAVSKTLKELEDRLGVALFEREGRSLKLTEAGRLFRKHAGASLSELEIGVRALTRPEETRRRIVVGVLPTVATRVMPKAALAFAEAAPGARLRISTGPNWMLLSQLHEGALDLVVGRMADPGQMKGLAFEQLFVDPVVAVVRPDHPLLGAPVAEFLDRPLILPPPGAVIRPVVEQYFLSIGREMPAAMVETVSLAVGRGLTRDSDAIWFISRGVVADELDAGILAALDLGFLPLAGSIGITRRAGAPSSEELELLMRALRDSVDVE
jgi:LysR family pca operon transcriptional activator